MKKRLLVLVGLLLAVGLAAVVLGPRVRLILVGGLNGEKVFNADFHEA